MVTLTFGILKGITLGSKTYGGLNTLGVTSSGYINHLMINRPKGAELSVSISIPRQRVLRQVHSRRCITTDFSSKDAKQFRTNQA